MRANDDKTEMPGAFFGLGVAIVFVAGAMGALLSAASQLGPHLGDIVTFRPGTPVSTEFASDIIAQHLVKDGTALCTLNAGQMASSGGSLFVESEIDGRNFRVHWAGGHTTSDPRDCGLTADLVVERSDLQSLVAAAGGYGAQQGARFHQIPPA